MTTGRKELLRAYTRTLADMMGLRDWFITVNFGEIDNPPEYDADGLQVDGVCEPIPNQRKAKITYRPNVDDNSPYYIRHLVVHELLHCHFVPMREYPRAILDKQLPQVGYDIFMGGYDMRWEECIDNIAAAWALQLPLIGWAD
jgi:hypothetical protein